MRIPLTAYGLRELLAGSVLCLGAAALCVWLAPPLAVLPALCWLFLLSFFRDPKRPCACAEAELLSPADGTVSDIEEVAAPAFLEGRALRIGIFMSILNVHVNRSPAAGTVRQVWHVPGRFHDARTGAARTENEHNFVGLQLADGHHVLVNQVAGVVARRIVCNVAMGQQLQRGERIGMVKFGSRVELYIPVADGPQPLVKVGDRVKGGLTVLARYAQAGGPARDAAR